MLLKSTIGEVLPYAESARAWVLEKRRLDKQEYIREFMTRKKYWFFGRALTRDEAEYIYENEEYGFFTYSTIVATRYSDKFDIANMFIGMSLELSKDHVVYLSEKDISYLNMR